MKFLADLLFTLYSAEYIASIKPTGESLIRNSSLFPTCVTLPITILWRQPVKLSALGWSDVVEKKL